jgi:hypothetical protein
MLESGGLPEPISELSAAAGADMRKLIDDNELPPPDIVRPGRNAGEAEFVWRDAKLLIIVGDDGPEWPGPM